MEHRIEKLEEFAVEVRGELRSIDVRLTKIEVILPTLATKADLASLRIDMEMLRGSMKADLDALRLSTTHDINSLKETIHQTATSAQKWMFATVIGLFLGFGGMMMGMSNALKTANQTPPAVTTHQGQAPPPR